MHPRIAQLCGVVALIALAAACGDPQLAPLSEETSLAQGGPEPRAPSNLSATAPSASQVNLSWEDNSPNESGFEVYRALGQGGTYDPVITTGANIKSYTDGDRTAGTEYCYQVRALKRSGSKTTVSAFTGPACAITLGPPAAATEASAVPQNSSTIGISWRESSSNESGFRVQRGPGETGPWTTVATTGPNVTQAQDAVSTDLPVCYQVVTFIDADRVADPSNIDCTAAPAAPANLKAAAGEGQAINLMWDPHLENPPAVNDGYQVQRLDPNTWQWSEIAVLPASATSYQDDGLVSDATYWYLVRATKDGGYSDYSNYAQALIASAPPAAPSNLFAYPVASSVALVNWTDNSINEERFLVQRAPAEAGPWETLPDEIGTDQRYFYDYGLTTEQRVCYRAIASNSKGTSGLSDVGCTVAPPAPANLQAATVDHQSIELTWELCGPEFSPCPAAKDGYSIRDGYRVYRFDYWYWDYVPIVDLPENATSFRDTGLESQTWYSYYVAALNDGDPNYPEIRGNSDWSNEASASTAVAPGIALSTTAVKPRPSSDVIRGAAARALTKALTSVGNTRNRTSSSSRQPPLPK
jgi:hypothetical protein